jgi:excisionase family DNA binding protein
VTRGLKIIPAIEEIENNSLQRLRPERRERQKKTPPGRRLVRVREAAEYLGWSPWKVRQLIAARRIPFVQDGDGPFSLDLRDLDSFIERSKRVV